MWGIVPAAGAGSRMKPLAFSKELLPVGGYEDGGAERPRAVSEYLVERMIIGGATRICFVISPGKTDILAYYGAVLEPMTFVYTVQPQPSGLCDAVFRAAPLVHPDELVAIGLPDTVWFPADGFSLLPDDVLSLLLFPVTRPELFDAVRCDGDGIVREVQVKNPRPSSHWIWGAMKMPGRVLHELQALWLRRGRTDEYFGTLINAYIDAGGAVHGLTAGETYVDVGTLHGYREAVNLLSSGAAVADRIGAERVRPS